MTPSHLLPFKVGQQAESKSFQKGFRGAWFRCKINKLYQTKDLSKALLEFYDYPGEKMHWTQLYQKRTGFIRSMDEREPQLILRPCFPPWYHESQIPDSCTISDLVVIVDGIWKVGDLVDWWYDGCYWSGRVTCLLGKDKVQVDLPDPPIGEGKSYEAFCKDLRPSLDWSLERGWTVPESETSRCCARLVQLLNKDNRGNENSKLASNTADFSSCEIISSISSTTLDDPLLPLKDNEQDNYKLVEYGGRCASCDTGTSVSSSALASSLLSPSGCIDPHANETSMLSSAREDNEKEIEVQSTKVSLSLDDGTKEVANTFYKVSSTSTPSVMPPSGCICPGVSEASTRSGNEETEDEAEVQSGDANLSLDDGRRVTSLGKASSARADSLSPQTGYVTPEHGNEETEQQMEIQSTNMIMNSDYSGRGITNSLDNASSTPACTLLPSAGYINPEINGRFRQGSGKEKTAQEVVQSTSVKFDSDCGRRGTISMLDKGSSELAASFVPSPVNEISRPGSWREENERKRKIQSAAMSPDSDVCRRETTSASETFWQRSGREENERTEIHSNDMNLDSDGDRRGIINISNQALATSVSFLPPVGCISPEINKTSRQRSGMEETEQATLIQCTRMNMDSENVEKGTIGKLDKASITSGALLLPSGCDNPETNDISMQSLGMRETVKNAEVGPISILGSVDGSEQISDLLHKASVSNEVKNPFDVAKVSCGKDQCNFEQFSKRLRITENHPSTSVTQANSVESSIMELEELANKIKWLKGLIIFGLRWPNTKKPSWKFSET